MKHPTKTFDPAATALSAIANASRVPIARAELRELLATGTGEPSHLRALFGDVALTVLLRLAIRYRLSDRELARAYLRARETCAAANPELDAFARDVADEEQPEGGASS